MGCVVKGVCRYVTLQISGKVCQVKCESCTLSAGKFVIYNLQAIDKYVEFVCILGHIFSFPFSFSVSVRKPHELLLSFSECSLVPTCTFTDATSATAQLRPIDLDAGRSPGRLLINSPQNVALQPQN
jgi:hypothetical protein